MKITAIIKLLIILCFPFITYSQSIITTAHNLSVSGTGEIKANTESEICIFCHTPHNSKPLSPLWNKDDPGTNYTLYNSSTIQASPGQPDGASMLCLSCHDGTIALGNVISRDYEIDFSAGVTTMPTGNSNLTTDLTDDHPISFVYNSSLATADGELKDPTTLSWPIKLENEKLQCISCHDPHKNIFGNFLVASTQYSDLCVSCHQKDYWVSSSHSNSNSTWNGSGTNPWFHTTYTTVSENACENCHSPHNANGNSRLMKYPVEENNCLDCHNGNVAVNNIQIQLNKPYNHNVYNYFQTHDTDEDATVLTRHVECVDCHNPHAARDNNATAPNVKGSIEGTIGVNQNGVQVDPAQYEYEICNRCHADSPDKPASSTSRQIEQNNVRLEFDLNNPSYHPVTGAGKNSNVPSLISPLTESSIIYCSDCHASDGGSSPAGPHGSIYPQILKYNYERVEWDNTYFAYELCFQCHDINIIESSHEAIRNTHAKKTSCNTCHDPHGISNSQGNSINNAYLINFDNAKVTPNNNEVLEFIDQGSGHGTCSLNCHNHNHDNSTY